MFDSLASRYDVMDALTGGLDRVWMTACRPSPTPSDASRPGGRHRRVVGRAIGRRRRGRRRHRRHDRRSGVSATPRSSLCTAMPDLDFEDGSFDAVTISWGLRNIPGSQLALRADGVVRPRGRLVVLGSTPPSRVFRGMYNVYQSTVMPAIARLVSTNDGAYDYLVESIARGSPGGAGPHDRGQRLEQVSTTSPAASPAYRGQAAAVIADHDEAGAPRSRPRQPG